ncbi:MAG: gamma-glutamyl-gamma-aminobutyrate hydrolase family protein [Acidimicrobiales bacterium]|nr:gamma-glutamyl-gamma-aminobutyrate hydrolase family protein [Acidimicrobiales bacterium]
MTRPLIGLTGRRKLAAKVIGTADNLQHLSGDWYYADYARGVLAAGGLPVNLPMEADPSAYVGHLDGILLSGGADIDPSRYDAPSETDAFPPEPVRDQFELDLMEAAKRAAVPVLGICRGLQLINVSAGGSLHQNVPEHARYDISSAALAHSISIAPDSSLAQLYGTQLMVNSLHHQTVDRLGKDLVATAYSDGVVEGLEHQTLPVLAVQWHPEMLDSRDHDPLFGWLVDQARTYRTERLTHH